MRAREPDDSGFVERKGVRVWWERFGTGEPAILFFHADPIVDSRMWKAQIQWFARRHTVLAFGPRGNGRSDRPSEANALPTTSSSPTPSPCSTRTASSGRSWSDCARARASHWLSRRTSRSRQRSGGDQSRPEADGSTRPPGSRRLRRRFVRRTGSPGYDAAERAGDRRTATLRPGRRRTDASTRREPPLTHTAPRGSASRLRTQFDRLRTVDTTMRSPQRAATNGTSRSVPERRPMVASTTAPTPTGSGEPRPLLTSGRTSSLRERNVSRWSEEHRSVTPDSTAATGVVFRGFSYTNHRDAASATSTASTASGVNGGHRHAVS